MPICHTSSVNSEAIYRHIGLLIKNRRKQLGLTQETLSKRLAISRASLASIETGRQNVLVHQLYRLAMALQLEPRDFLPTLGGQKNVPDQEELPLPSGLSAQQREQIARLLLSGADGGANFKDDTDEYPTKIRARKGGTRTS